MNLNPITALSEQLQKLINEHGSAAILRDHLALFKDQLVIYEKKVTELAAENKVLTRKIEESETKKQELEKDNNELRQKIQEYENPHKNLLDDTKIQILKLLFKLPKLQIEQIIQTLSIALPVAEFHLSDLRKLKMVKQEALPSNTIRTPIGWSLDKEGTRFLIEQKLA